MALNSPSHRFGQIIGDILETTMIHYLSPVAEKYSLYLDYKHPRIARNGNKEVQWEDINGNKHKLDIVMEKNGDESRFGEPRIFIETAWRRYTKHSKNKAQEISGAIKPLIEKYKVLAPFFGAIVAGDFTQNSINQMISEGFEVVYIPIALIQKAFETVNIDASWEEDTPENVLQEKIDSFNRLNDVDKDRIRDELINLTSDQLNTFRLKVMESLERRIESIRIMSLYGEENLFASIQEACDFISGFVVRESKPYFYKFEIYVRYSNGDKFEAHFADRRNAVTFLEKIS